VETKRPTVEAAEEILGGYFPALDHGFVSLVDYMGTDEDVESAARVSYGAGTRKVSLTRGLIRYLRRHRHTTPSEMVEFKFHCAMPMFIARQWIRHRTACLAEGTEVYFDLPGAEARGRRQLHKLPIEEIWKRFQPTENTTRPDKQRNPFFRRDQVQGMRLRQANEDTLALQHTRVVDVYKNGRKPVFRMVLEDGKTIEATSDHRYLFDKGGNKLRGERGLRETGGRAVWSVGDHLVQVNGAAEKLPALYQDPIYKTRLVRIARFEYVGERKTYDLEVEGPHHNFVANGIITHNSVNEYSGRYSLMPLLFYMPDQEHFGLQSQTNNQGRADDAPEGVYSEAVERWERIRSEAATGYTWMVGEDVAREIARIDLPLSTYTQWYWKIDLHNLLHFLSLRADPHAQWEIRVFADIIAGMVKRVAPLSYEAWVDYDLTGHPMSRAELDVLAQLLETDDDGVSAASGERFSVERLKEAGLSKREIEEFMAKLTRTERPDHELDLSTMRSAEDVEAEMAAAVPKGTE
jgi:flavin-dependent thymidylate synthase